MAGRQLRMRMVTIEPGSVFGPVHDHKGRPGIVFILRDLEERHHAVSTLRAHARFEEAATVETEIEVLEPYVDWS